MDEFEMIESGLPEELPASSVVLDKSKKAWQSFERDGKTWWVKAIRREDMGYTQSSTWGQLLIEEGPLAVIYRNEVQ